jgi:pimeloyl-ACP methyl ester carboxylesterase
MTDHTPTTGAANLNGTQLHYTISGPAEADALVMIHAGIADQRMWAPQVAHFSAEWRVVTLDMRGFGQTPMVEGSFAFYEDVHALLDHLGIARAWIMGCSLGGGVTLDLALVYPAQVRGLILVGAAIGGYRYDGPALPQAAAIEAAFERGELETVSELEVQLWVDGPTRTPDQVDPAVRDLVREMNLIPLRVDDALWEQETEPEPPALERLESITQPALVLIGDLDIPASQARSDLLARRLPKARKAVVLGTAHVPNMEQPERFNELVDEFLAAHPGA